jgi:hypothetical protein
LIPEYSIAEPAKQRRRAGRKRVSSEQQNEKANSPILASFDPDSNVTSESFAHPSKQWSGSVSIDDGMPIDCSEAHPPNAESPRSESFESGSNVKVERFAHAPKQDLEIVSIDDGIQMD